jgi:2-oxoglutarate ferredoxin oxidoreductase subunit beta
VTDLIVEGIQHPGLAFIQAMSPCPTFYNTFDLWRPQIEELPEGYDPGDRAQALVQAFRDDALPVGVLYRELRPTLDSQTRVTDHPLKSNGRGNEAFDVRALLESYR